MSTPDPQPSTHSALHLQERVPRKRWSPRTIEVALLAGIACVLVLLAVAWTIDREAGLVLQQAEALPALQAAPLKQQAAELLQRAARWKELSGTMAVAGMLAAVLLPGGAVGAPWSEVGTQGGDLRAGRGLEDSIEAGWVETNA